MWYGWGLEMIVDCVIDKASGKVRTVVKKVNFIAVYVDKELPQVSKGHDASTRVPEEVRAAEDTKSKLIDYWQRRVHATLDDSQQLSRYNIKEWQLVTNEGGMAHVEHDFHRGTVTNTDTPE
jgi:hypothetical protein